VGGNAVITSTSENSVSVITLDRHAKRNALDVDHLDQLDEAVTQCLSSGTRVVVITGAGNSFCSGADLSGVYHRDFRAALYRTLGRITAAPVPVIAAVNGPAIGAGAQLAIACDLRVVAAAARFAVPTAQNGLAVDPWTIRRLHVLAGGGTARALLLACATVSAEMALTRGLADQIGSFDDALALAHDMVGLSPASLTYSKRAMHMLLEPSHWDTRLGDLSSPGGDAKVLAGGQSLVPVLAMRLGRPSVLVDINRIAGLDGIDELDEQTVRVGALVRHCALVDQDLLPLLAEAARRIGHTAIRTRGTAGGSIAHADPAAELPVVAVALEARIHVVGVQGRRTISANDFFVGPLETSLAEDEIVLAIDFPRPERWGFAEFARRHGDFGLVTVVAAQVAGTVRLAVGGVGAVPLRARGAEEVLASGGFTKESINTAARAAARAVTASADLHASADYRAAMTEEFTRRAVLQLLGANNGSD
jgi:carbon-monoxide dehydrogenase medium subunit